MSSIQIPAAVAALTADGDVAGYVTVASNVPFYPGATVWLRESTTPLSQECIITDLSGSTKVGLRFKRPMDGGARYVRNSCVAFTVVKNAVLSQEAQVCPVEQDEVVKKLFV